MPEYHSHKSLPDGVPSLDTVKLNSTSLSKDDLLNMIKSADSALCSLIKSKYFLEQYESGKEKLTEQIELLSTKIKNWNPFDAFITSEQTISERFDLLDEKDRNIETRNELQAKFDIYFASEEYSELQKEHNRATKTYIDLLNTLIRIANESSITVPSSDLKQIVDQFEHICAYIGSSYGLSSNQPTAETKSQNDLNLKCTTLMKSIKTWEVVTSLSRHSKVRPQLDHDIHTVFDIEQKCMDNPLDKEAISENARHSQFVPLVIETNKVVRGSMLIQYRGSDAQIIRILVDPDYQNQGLGAKLIKYLIDKLDEENDIFRITAKVNELNLGAQLFFKSCGFLSDCVERNPDDSSGQDLYVFAYQN